MFKEPEQQLVAANKCEGVCCGLVSEQAMLDNCVAYSDVDFPLVADANQVRDVQRGAMEAEQVWRQVVEHFAKSGLDCLQWSFPLGRAEDSVVSFLLAHGFIERRVTAMAMQVPPGLQVDDSLRMFPAGSVEQHYIALQQEAHDRFSAEVADQMVQYLVRRLGRPRLESYVAFYGKVPVGTLELLSVGPVGRIANVYVAASHRRRGVATGMFAWMFNLCLQRSRKCVCLSVAKDQPVALELYQKLGFQQVGELISYLSPGLGES